MGGSSIFRGGVNANNKGGTNPLFVQTVPVADPGFFREDAATPQSANFFAENCLKMKEFGPEGVPGAPLDSPIGAMSNQDLSLRVHSHLRFFIHERLAKMCT